MSTEPPDIVPTLASREALEKELVAAYDAAKQCFTLLFALIAAAVGADAGIVVAAFKSASPVLSILPIGSVIVLLAVWGALLLGQGVGNLGAVILRLERELDIPMSLSPAYAVLQTYGEREQRAITDAAWKGEAPETTTPSAFFSWRQWPVLVTIVIGVVQLAAGVPLAVDRLAPDAHRGAPVVPAIAAHPAEQARP